MILFVLIIQQRSLGVSVMLIIMEEEHFFPIDKSTNVCESDEKGKM